jgi:hypothetical protein
MFHDFGLTANDGRTDSFEIDGGSAARDYLLDNGSSIQETYTSPTRGCTLHGSSPPASRNDTSAQTLSVLPTYFGGKFGTEVLAEAIQCSQNGVTPTHPGGTRAEDQIGDSAAANLRVDIQIC